MVREVASRTSDTAGDGTTTATVLVSSIVEEGAKTVAAGSNPMALKRGIDMAVEKVVADIKKISNKDNIQGGDRAGRNDLCQRRSRHRHCLIAEAMNKVGKDGVITVEESRTLETSLDVVEGMKFDRGYLSPYFVTDAREEASRAGRLLHSYSREKDFQSFRTCCRCLSRLRVGQAAHYYR